MKTTATPEQINALGGELKPPPLTYPSFLDSYLYQIEQDTAAKKPVPQKKKANSEGIILFMEWFGILVMILLAGWVQ